MQVGWGGMRCVGKECCAVACPPGCRGRKLEKALSCPPCSLEPLRAPQTFFQRVDAVLGSMAAYIPAVTGWLQSKHLAEPVRLALSAVLLFLRHCMLCVVC